MTKEEIRNFVEFLLRPKKQSLISSDVSDFSLGSFILNNSGNVFDVLKLAENRRVDFVMLGDSNQTRDTTKGYGPSLAKHLGAKYGVYASSVYFNGNGAHDNYYDFHGYTTPITALLTDINVNHADLFPNNGKGSLTSDTIINNGMIIRTDKNFNASSDLRYWLGWGGYDSGSGSFSPLIRIQGPPYTTLAGNVPVSTNTGDFSKQLSYVDLAAAERTLDMLAGFSIGASATVTAPFTFLFHRMEDIGLDSGISYHTFYGESGASLRDMVIKLNAYTDNQLSGYFEEIRRLQVSKGLEPKIVIYINSGLNDKTDTDDSLGYLGFDSSTKYGYMDNISALINRIEHIWKVNSWDKNELSFLTIASHPISNPNDSQLEEFRAGLQSLSERRNNLTAFDLSAFFTYDTLLALDYYNNPPSDLYHLKEAGYEALSQIILRELL